MVVNHQKEISLLVNLARASAKIDSIIIIEKKKMQPIRPWLNIILQAQIGAGKSAIMNEIAAAHKVPVYTELTLPGLVGGIGENSKMPITGAAWDRRNSLLLLDEWHTYGRGGAMDALLQLTESGTYTRKLSRECVMPEEKDGPLSYSSGGGTIKIRTHFATIAATMHNMARSIRPETQAFVSRCIPYSFKLGKKELRNISNGHPLYVPFDFRVKKKYIVPFKTWNRILNLCDKSASELVYLRTAGDMARTTCILGRWDAKILQFIIEKKNVAAKAQEKQTEYFSE